MKEKRREKHPTPLQHGDLRDWSRDQLENEVRLLRNHLDVLLERSSSGESDAGAANGLDTVSVPDGFAEPFLAAQDYVRRYFSSLVHEPQKATISIAGERYILLRAASMSVEFVELVTSLYRDRGPVEARGVANNLLFDFAHALGKADALSFQEKMGVTDPIAKLSAGPVHFAFSGWAYVDIDPASNPSPDQDYFLLYDHPFSFESHSWLSKGRTSAEPVCVMNAGYSSGWCEESFGLPLVAAEIECRAAGDDRCRFVMAPPSRIEEHLARQGFQGRPGEPASDGNDGVRKRGVAVPEFFQRRRWEDELRKANLRLEERVEERTAELLAATRKLQLLATAVENAVEGIVTMRAAADGRLTIETVNRGFSKVSGLPEKAAVGQGLESLAPVDADRDVLDIIYQQVAAGNNIETEMTARRPDGTEYTLELHLMPGATEQHGPGHWIALLRDVTRRHRYFSELRRQATYDALTKLPNRVLLFDRLKSYVDQPQGGLDPLALLVIDLDGFKEVNDTFGHHAGDALLEQVGPRLRQQVRSTDTVARLGGDEFAILLPGISNADNAVTQAKKILDALHDPFQVEGQELLLGASIGIVLYPEHGEEATTLLRRADVAMYVAKESRRGLSVYHPDDDANSPERLTLVGELRAGIESDELVNHYQVQICPDTGRPGNIEALVRWQHPQHGLLSPEEFIPFIELGNLVEQLTDWVLDRAAAACVDWNRNGQEVGISVNVAPRSLRDHEFPARVAGILDRHDLAPERLTLEVTESGLLLDPELSLPVFRELRAMNIRLSIDDFGTGYSSLVHLRKLPVDEIKIDRSFVVNMMEDPQDEAIVRATIQLGRNIGRTIVAEGVEREETLERLRELGCDLVQGYFVAEPMEQAEMLEWLKELLPR